MASRPKRPTSTTGGEPFDDEELAAWHGLLRTHAAVIRALDEQLERHHHLSVSEFDVLITLANAPDEQFRMTELAERVMLSPSGLTRLVARLEREGLVSRVADPSDGRSARARLLPAGRSALDDARSTHNRVIRELFLHRLGAKDRKALGAAWSKVSGDRSDPSP